MPGVQQGSRLVPAAAVLCRGLAALFCQLSSSKPAPHEVPDAIAERAAAAGALRNLLAYSQAAKVSCCKPCHGGTAQHCPDDVRCQAGGHASRQSQSTLGQAACLPAGCSAGCGATYHAAGVCGRLAWAADVAQLQGRPAEWASGCGRHCLRDASQPSCC